LERLPDEIHGILEEFLEDLKSRESVSSIGIFGSRSRGDDAPGSDIDLLIVDKRELEYEYVERVEIENTFFDLNFVPEKWITEQVPPDMDQKLYEVQTLYDRDGKLAKAKDLMSHLHWKRERVEIRTGDYVMQADTYLSRGFSALNKGDFQSAKVNASIALDSIMKLFIEVNKIPLSNSSFVRAVESSTEKFTTKELYDKYIEIAGLANLNKQIAEMTLAALSKLWHETIVFVTASSPVVDILHVRVKNDLNYYCKESFVRGLQARAGSLINNKLYAEAVHYSFCTAISMLENYVWLVSTLDGKPFDYTDPFQHLKGSLTSPKSVYDKAVEAFRLEGTSSSDANYALQGVKEIVLRIRAKRKELIARWLT
jgi:predicted nucleotidyltransferase